MGKEEDKYIKYLKSNDSQGIKEIYDTYLPRIESIIGGMGGNKQEAWEIFQESLIVILNRIQNPDFQLSSSFYTFLVSICKFKWFNESKKKYKKNVTIDNEKTLKDDQDILQTIMKIERFELYKQKLDDLGGECKSLLELYFDKIPMREIAIRLGLNSENAAKQKKYKCQRKLIEMIKNDSKFEELL